MDIEWINILIVAVIIVFSVWMYLWFIYYISTDHKKIAESNIRFNAEKSKMLLIEQRREMEKKLVFLQEIEEYEKCDMIKKQIIDINNAIDYINGFL